MRITVKYHNAPTQVINGTATTAAYLVSEGHDVWLEDAAWRRVYKRMNKLGLTDAPEIDPEWDGVWETLLAQWANAEYKHILATEGGVEGLWEELEILGLVAEWDPSEEGWI